MIQKKRSTPAPRDRILAAAAELFHREGIRGVGVEAIAEAAGTNKMTLYRHFSSKDELIAEWVRSVVARKEAEWEEIAAMNPGDARAQLVDWSRRVAKKLAEMDERGPAIGNTLAELPEKDHPARLVIAEHQQRQHKRIVRLCREAGFREPELAADQFLFLLEGAHACVVCVGLKRVGDQLVRMVDAMVAESRTRTRA